MRAALCIALLPLAACAASPAPGPAPSTNDPLAGNGTGQCDPAPAASLVGQKATPEIGAQALKLSGAKTLRWGPPRSAFTMDFSITRVNVMYDDAMIITEITCA